MELTKCGECQGGIGTEEITRVLEIPKSPEFLAVIYDCGQCGNSSRLVVELEEWRLFRAAVKEAEKAKPDETVSENDLRSAKMEVDAIQSAEDLVALWSSLKTPPVREAVKDACGCPECNRRLYG